MMTRSQFLRSLLGAGVGVVGASMLVGCSDGGSPGPAVDAQGADGPAVPTDAPKLVDAPPQQGCAMTASTISVNHGHALAVPAADVLAGVEKTYDIKGTSAHPHAITVTAAMFAMLKLGTAITVTSTNVGNHTHDVTVTCA
jgi:hypothetical protein